MPTSLDRAPEIKRTVVFTPRQREFLTLIGMGMSHKLIAPELGVTVDSSQTMVRNLILRAGFVTDIQTVVYAVGSHQIARGQVFRDLTPDRKLLLPNSDQLRPGQVRIVPYIAWGPFRHRDPNLNIKPGTIASEAYRIRRLWGLNSNSQVVITGIDRGYTTYDDVLAPRREPSTAEFNWGLLSDKEQQLVRGIWLGKTTKELRADFGVSTTAIEKAKKELRDKAGVVNDFQLAVKLFHVPELDAIDMFPRFRFKDFADLASAELRVLNAYLAKDGVNFNNPEAIEISLGLNINNVYKLRKNIQNRLSLPNWEQTCLLYTYAIEGGYLDQDITR